MTYAEQILREILTEEANLNSVTDAIKKRYEVEITYKADDEEKGQGKRVIQPVVLGHSKSGNLVLRAFQPYGDTKTKTPHWKMFRLDKIEDWKGLKKRRFQEPPDSQYNAEGKYNPDGDKTMSDVLIQADFRGANAYRKCEGSYAGLKKANDERAAAKREKEPYYGLKKNISKSYNGNNIDYIRKNIEDWQKSQAAKEFRRGNNASAYEMSQVQNFGDENVSQTVGPVMKNNTEIQQKENEPLSYDNVVKNSPVYKSDNTEEIEKDIENNETEENKVRNGF